MSDSIAGTAAASTRTRGDEASLWFKDAVIYQLHVRSFYDSNGDGVGDFPGLTEKLDYIQDLGVTAIWLLPFFPSPLKDGGYDISDYNNVNPVYGTLRDFKTFLRESHRRGLRVITELVTNHTSDQHQWFQRSRRASPGSRWRDYYVWSDDPSRYAEARVIFEDFESSNWTWDPVAEAYYWHRFYHHQPDLNYDNPEVRTAVSKLFDFWLDMGVDGLRLDAVPYLFEREGTNCENLPETHAYLKDLRQHVESKFPDSMLLAEANQWPEDAAAYFGDGDECHMNFHFPLMPRLFMAVEREDRFPIIDILDQTPELPQGCQWGIFLRNHDELTLEMVTDEERNYMLRAYAADPQSRLNLGIRRRLAPLLKNNRRKMELMNALLLSLPGTPIIYYGDEIGMGDNIYLGDRDGVRTPMQWNSDRNAGFSRANPQRLFLPVVIDSEYHYASRNVEIDENSPHSLLWWMRRTIKLRKQFQAFGRGSLDFLLTDNSKVLCFLRRHEDETILVVANLSRFSQCTEMDLSEFRGQTPVELFGQTQFPAIGELPYFLTLGPYAFYWFRIQWAEQELVELATPELPACRVEGSWENIFEDSSQSDLSAALTAYLQKQRWFASNDGRIASLELLDVFTVPEHPQAASMDNGQTCGTTDAAAPQRLILIRVHLTEGEAHRYALPVVLADEHLANNIIADHPNAGILLIRFGDGAETQATLCEATWETEFWKSWLEQISRRRTLRGMHGELAAMQTKAFRLRENDGDDAPVQPGQKSNMFATFGNRFLLKMFRRLRAGENPDFEIPQMLSGTQAQPFVPQVAGGIRYQPGDGQAASTLAVLNQYVPNEGDAWSYTLDELGRYLERVQSELQSDRQQLNDVAGLLEMAGRDPVPLAREAIGPYLQAAQLLGRRTAQMHLALASAEHEAFAPEPFSKLYQRSLYQSMRTHARRILQLLRRRLRDLSEDLVDDAEKLLRSEREILDRFHAVLDQRITAQRLRCHGDFHLGHVLFTGSDFVIIDFEGELDKSIGERRIKQSPLRDVAGMLRSLFYASRAWRLDRPSPGLPGHQQQAGDSEAWLHFWYCWSAASFLRAYLAEAGAGDYLPQDQQQLGTLLDALLLEKALLELKYELRHQLKNRPDWVKIPIDGILRMLGQPEPAAPREAQRWQEDEMGRQDA